MKILIVNSLYYPNIIGGAERSVQLLAESLAEAGETVSVVTTNSESREEMVNGVRVHYIKAPNLYWMHSAKDQPAYKKPLWHMIDSYNQLVRTMMTEIIERECPDVVHTNNLAGLSVSVWKAAHDCGVPIVHTIRDHYLLCARGLMFHAGRLCTRQCLYCRVLAWPRKRASKLVDATVGLSKFMLEKHERYGYFRNARLKTHVYNSAGRQTVPQGERGKSGELVFGYVGQLAPAKGIEYLLQRFRRMNVAGAKLQIFGRALDESYGRRLHDEYAGRDIEFCGFRKIDEVYPGLDVVIIPSLCDDALTRTLIEAYSFGVPAIATTRGGVGELVVEGETGYLFDPAQEGALEDRIRRFLGDHHLTRRMSKNCIEHSQRNPHEAVARRYREIYRSVVTDR